MPKITNFRDKNARALVSTAFLDAIKAKAEDLGFGVTVEYAGGSYEPGEFVIKFRAKLTGDSAHDAERAKFAAIAPLFGFEPTDYGRTFDYQGRTMKLIGFNPKAPRYPLQIQEVSTGKTFRFTEIKRERLQPAAAQ